MIYPWPTSAQAERALLPYEDLLEGNANGHNIMRIFLSARGTFTDDRPLKRTKYNAAPMEQYIRQTFEVLEEIFPDLEHALLWHVLLVHTTCQDSITSNLPTTQDEQEKVLTGATIALEHWRALQAGEFGNAGVLRYQKLVDHFANFWGKMQGRNCIFVDGKEDVPEEGDTNAHGDLLKAEQLINNLSEVAKQPEQQVSDLQPLWANHRMKTGQRPASCAQPNDVVVGDQIALYFDDGDSGWWDATVTQIKAVTRTMKIKFEGGSCEEMELDLMEWQWRLYR